MMYCVEKGKEGRRKEARKKQLHDIALSSPVVRHHWLRGWEGKERRKKKAPFFRLGKDASRTWYVFQCSSSSSVLIPFPCTSLNGAKSKTSVLSF